MLGWPVSGEQEFQHLKVAALQGSFALFLRHLGGFLLNFGGGIILARMLGPEILGLYFISYTILIVFRGVIDFGIGVHLIRLPHHPSRGELNVAFIFQQVIGVAGLIIVISLIAPLLASWYGQKDLFLLIASAGVGAYFYTWQCIPVALLERKLWYRKVGLVEIFEFLTFNLVAVAGVLAGAGVMALAAGNILRGLAPGLIAILTSGFRPALLFDRVRLTALIKRVAPVFGSNLIVYFIMLGPPLVVGKLAGPRPLGLAQQAYNLLGNMAFLASIIQRVGLSAFSRLQEDRARFNRAVNKVLRLLALGYIPLVMGIASLSAWWVPIVYGAQWQAMAHVIVIAALPVTAAALLSSLMSALLAKGHAPLVFWQNALHAAIYWILLALLAIPLGAVSVAVAHLAAMSAGCLFIYGYKKYCGQLHWSPLVAQYAMGACCMVISWSQAVKGHIIFPIILWGGFVLASAVLSPAGREALSLLQRFRARTV